MYVNKEFGSEEKPKAIKRSVLIDKKNFYQKKIRRRRISFFINQDFFFINF